MKDIVIIGGSFEAFALAQKLPQARVILPAPERGVRDWAPSIGLTKEALAGARCVVEAAHPCDTATAMRVAAMCAAQRVARVQLVRPAWRAGRFDRWHMLRHPALARQIIPQNARVLVTTGRWALPSLRGLKAHLLVRRLGPVERFPLRSGRFLPAGGPFTVAEEMRFMRKERIDWLLLHNAGGLGGWPKLAAARRLGLQVAMLDRPRRPDGPRVETVERALEWLHWQNG